MRLPYRLLAGSAVGATVLLSGVGPAAAEEPFAPTEQLTDNADVLDSGQEQQVQDAITQLQEADGTQLYVVFVDTFDGATADTWAE